MSTSDFLFQSQAPSVWTAPSWESTTAPAWWQAAAQGLIGRASQVAGQDYQPYSGPRIAGLDPLQQNAVTNANAYAPGVNQTLNSATGLAQGAGDLYNQSDFDQFMSPYTTGVVDRIADLGARNLREKLLPEVNDTFIRAGQFGGSRNADFTARALRDTQESILGQQATALESAQKNAMGAYQDAQGRQLQAGQTMGALGQISGNESRNQLENMMKIGTVPQSLQQANLDLAAKDFENQVNYPQQQLQLLNSIIRGYQPTGSSTTTSYSAANPANVASYNSPLANIAGTLNAWSSGAQ